MFMLWILFLFSLVFVRFYAGYDSRFQKGKFIRIKNRRLRQFLIDETSFFDKSNRPKQDLGKISYSGVALYVFSFVVFCLSIISYFVFPQTPVDPWRIETDDFVMHVDTLNEKVSSGFIWVYLLSIIFCLATNMIQYCKVYKSRWIKILVYACSVAMILAVIIAGVDVVREMVACFW